MRLTPFRRRPRKLKTKKFQEGWQDLQKYCATRKTWPQAIMAADDLLSDALKQKRYKGKTTGERLVAAQHDLSANDMAWFGHKLRDKIVDQDVRTLKKQDILEALAGFRQALRDLGALEK
jgi:hypothetical protein